MTDEARKAAHKLFLSGPMGASCNVMERAQQKAKEAEEIIDEEHAALREERDRYKDALEFYSAEENWTGEYEMDDGQAVDGDKIGDDEQPWTVAREALNPKDGG